MTAPSAPHLSSPISHLSLSDTSPDDLLTLRDTIADIERAGSLEARLRAIAAGAERLGFASAAVVLVSASGSAEFVIAADPAPAGADDIVARAKPAAWDVAFDDDAQALSFPLGEANTRALARLVVARPPEGYPQGRTPTLRLLGGLAFRAIDDARLVEVAERRAARLHRLQEVGGMLARSLDEREIQRELARHVQRVLPCRGVIIAHPDVERGTATIALHIDGGSERARGVEPLGGVLAEVAKTGRALRIASIGPDPASLAAAGELIGGASAGIGSVLAAPMLLGIQLVGVVAVYGSTRTTFNAEDEDLLANIAGQAASAIVNARLFEESQRERRQSEALSEIARAVGESLRAGDVMRLIQRHAVALLRANGAMVMIRKGEFLHIVAGIGSGDLLAGMYLPLVGSLSGRAVRTGQCYLSNNTSRESEIYYPALELASVRRTVIAPLVTERGAIGALAVLDRDDDFTEDDARVLQRLADHVAVAVVNARLYEEISEATRELAITFDAIAGGLVVVDDDRRLKRCNSRAVDLLGAPNEDALHLRDFAEALLGDEHAGDAWPLTKALAEHAPHRGTVRNPRTGRVFDLVASPHPSGGAVVFFDDVTSYHALADRYRDLMERASDAIYTLDSHATITSANAAMLALVGVPRDQLVGRSLIPFLDPDELDRLRGHFRASNDGEARRYECHLVRPDGSARFVSVSSTPFRQGEAIVGVLCIARDVTDERAAAVALERAESRYARLVESATDAIFTVDEEGVFTSVNRALVDAVGVPREDLLGRHFTDIIVEDERGAAWDMFVQTLAGHRVRREIQFSAAAGVIGTANVVTAPIVESGRVVGALGIIRDLTEERELLAQFGRQERLAALGQMASTVVHELNSPLGGITAHAQLIEKAIAQGEDGAAAARVIAAEAARAGKIVAKLLSFSRRGGLERSPVDVNALLRATVELRASVLHAEGIELATQFDETLPALEGDAAQLQQVFVNLLANAEHAVLAVDGERRIELVTERLGEYVQVSVRDSGIGIPPEHLDRIFDPYFTTKPRGHGTGLGLSISDGIVREHGGRLFVQSAPDLGTTFVVELPVRNGGTR